MRVFPLAGLYLVALVTPPTLKTQSPDTPLSEERPVAGSVSSIVFSFQPRNTTEPAWRISLQADGSGTYWESRPDATQQPIHVSPAVWQRLNSGDDAVRSGRCETRQKGIAQTGTKTLTLKKGDAETSCTFNFSDDEKLNDTATAFQALAETMQQGAKVKHDHRFDRLSLDADMEAISAEVQAGRALEPGNIAPVLQALVDDDRVIDRARRRAARLLQAATPEPDKPR